MISPEETITTTMTTPSHHLFGDGGTDGATATHLLAAAAGGEHNTVGGIISATTTTTAARRPSYPFTVPLGAAPAHFGTPPSVASAADQMTFFDNALPVAPVAGVLPAPQRRGSVPSAVNSAKSLVVPMAIQPLPTDGCAAQWTLASYSASQRRLSEVSQCSSTEYGPTGVELASVPLVLNSPHEPTAAWPTTTQAHSAATPLHDAGGAAAARRVSLSDSATGGDALDGSSARPPSNAGATAGQPVSATHRNPTAVLPPWRGLRTAPTGKSLFVSKLDRSVDFIRLREMFAPYGKVLSTRVLFDAVSGHSRGIGYVNFDKADDAAAALAAMAGTVPVAGQPALVVKYADEDSSFVPEETTKSFARCIPNGTSAADVRRVFGKFGTIVAVTIHRDAMVTDPRCSHALMAYVTYDTVESAVKAVAELNGTLPFARSTEPLFVKLAETQGCRKQRLERLRQHDLLEKMTTVAAVASSTVSPPNQQPSREQQQQLRLYRPQQQWPTAPMDQAASALPSPPSIGGSMPTVLSLAALTPPSMAYVSTPPQQQESNSSPMATRYVILSPDGSVPGPASFVPFSTSDASSSAAATNAGAPTQLQQPPPGGAVSLESVMAFPTSAVVPGGQPSACQAPTLISLPSSFRLVYGAAEQQQTPVATGVLTGAPPAFIHPSSYAARAPSAFVAPPSQPQPHTHHGSNPTVSINPTTPPTAPPRAPPPSYAATAPVQTSAAAPPPPFRATPAASMAAPSAMSFPHQPPQHAAPSSTTNTNMIMMMMAMLPPWTKGGPSSPQQALMFSPQPTPPQAATTTQPPPDSSITGTQMGLFGSSTQAFPLVAAAAQPTQEQLILAFLQQQQQPQAALNAMTTPFQRYAAVSNDGPVQLTAGGPATAAGSVPVAHNNFGAWPPPSMPYLIYAPTHQQQHGYGSQPNQVSNLMMPYQLPQ